MIRLHLCPLPLPGTELQQQRKMKVKLEGRKEKKESKSCNACAHHLAPANAPESRRTQNKRMRKKNEKGEAAVHHAPSPSGGGTSAYEENEVRESGMP